MAEAILVPKAQPWYRGLTRAQWITLIAANLGWLFDGYETYALVVAVGAALKQLLEPAQLAQTPVYAGVVLALTFLGWGIGGLIGAVSADYFGRKRTMILAVLAYSLTTGLSAFAWDWQSFAVLRFVVGVAIGSEWVTGVSMVSELWPDDARGRGLGLMQAGAGIGFFLAAFAWLFVGAAGPGAWRIMFLIGVLPALLTLWVRRAVPESRRWEHVDAQRRNAVARKHSGAALHGEDVALARFTVAGLFAEHEIRRRTILALLMSLATTFAVWGISSWIPLYVAAVADGAGLPGQAWASYAGMAYNAATLVGYVAFGFLADAFGRKPVTLAFVAAALATVPIVFAWTHAPGMLVVGSALLGAFVSGQYTWMTVWLPELYPTRMRATGAGFVFNMPRLIAWVGPLIAGTLIANFGGFGRAAIAVSLIYILSLAAAPFLPETRGKPLPE